MDAPGLTTICAIWGAALSTIVAAAALWDRRRRLKVDIEYDYSSLDMSQSSRRGVRVTVSNPSRQTVSVENIGVSLHKDEWAACEPVDRRWPEGLPLDLPPGNSLSICMDFQGLKRMLDCARHAVEIGSSGGVVVRGACIDGMSKVRYSRRLEVETLRHSGNVATGD
jgi:hypothetical protein